MPQITKYGWLQPDNVYRGVCEACHAEMLYPAVELRWGTLMIFCPMCRSKVVVNETPVDPSGYQVLEVR